MSTERKVGTALVAVAVAGAWVLALAAPASAHAAFKSSQPADESSVSSPPSEVWAEYTEPPAEGSYIHVTDPCGRRVDIGSPTLTGYRMTVAMAADKAGTYRADWFAFSSLDPHTTSGTFVFTVTGGEPCPGSGGSGGGGGGGSSVGSGGSGGTGSSATGSGAGSTDGSEADATFEREGTQDGGRGTGGRGSNASQLRGDNGSGGPILVQAPEEPEAPPIWEGIPLTSFLIGLALAAAIGAAGGKMYAGIVNPRR